MSMSTTTLPNNNNNNINLNTTSNTNSNLTSNINSNLEFPKAKGAIEYAYAQVVDEGASTLCLLSLDTRRALLYTSKIGDGGYIVLRPNYNATEMNIVSDWMPFKNELEHPMGIRSTHYLTSPILKRKIGGKSPSDAIESIIQVAPGDVVIAATDGFFDVVHVYGSKGARFRNDILEMVVRQRLDPKVLAERLTLLARHCARKGNADCPICDEARLCGDFKHATEVQSDDIAVVVACIYRA